LAVDIISSDLAMAGAIHDTPSPVIVGVPCSTLACIRSAQFSRSTALRRLRDGGRRVRSPREGHGSVAHITNAAANEPQVSGHRDHLEEEQVALRQKRTPSRAAEDPLDSKLDRRAGRIEAIADRWLGRRRAFPVGAA
jgi:hypothetical protein